MDPTSNPKYDPLTGKVETRGRKRKAEAAPLHHVAAKAQQDAADKMKDILSLISNEFGGMRNFLKQWTDNQYLAQGQLKARNHFLNKGGALEVITTWLPYTQKLVMTSKSGVVNSVVAAIETEIQEVLNTKDSPLRYVSKNTEEPTQGQGHVLYGSLCSSLDDMKVFLEEKAPIAWRIFQGLSQGRAEKGNEDFVAMSSVLGLLNSRNQQINAYQVGEV